MFDISKNVNRLRRDIIACRADINRQRVELDRREQSCAELEKLLEPLNTLMLAAPRHPLPEPVKEKMRASQRARWERKRTEGQERQLHLDIDAAGEAA